MSDPLLLELTQKRLIAEDVLLCEFSLPGEQGFSFRAGQHIVLNIPNADTVIGRAFSISSHPKRTTSFDLIIKLNGTGVASNFFQDVQVGHTVTGVGPRGNFMIRTLHKPAVFIAAGVGIAPLFSMIVDILEFERFSEPVRLLFYKQEEGYSEIEAELRRLRETYSNFSFNIVIDERSCTDLLKIEEFSTHPEFYICGGKQFIIDMEGQLVCAGFASETIHYEQ